MIVSSFTGGGKKTLDIMSTGALTYKQNRCYEDYKSRVRVRARVRVKVKVGVTVRVEH
jgi:hypothetical protein